MSADDGVIGTNDDASSCKRFAVDKGYWHDPFISLLIPKATSRKAPEISRGYYARVKGIQILIEHFLRMTNCNCQIVNLGAGFDTMFWRLHEEGLTPKCYVEVDFEQVTARKCHYIKSKKTLLEALSGEDSEIMMSKTEIHSGSYHLVSSNLRNVGSLESKLTACDVDRGLPTLFLSECVLVYIETEHTDKLVKWVADSFPTAFFINYEQVNMGDSFGEVMIENLKTRDCLLSGVAACASLDTQMNRFLTRGWTGGDAMDMKTLYRCLPQADLQRIERLEMLDERELLDQLLSHYCLVWAYKDTRDIGLHTISIS
ncbi:leucine carboxyl methyltransferase 1 [Aplysia californica]|uniref:Leucine carboxyl methyltransferase 1 n=1 Tax=Aplysia californica TaxID=6500 RepID=A0ABM0K9T3_APLCA|nr:leucine carboxyl methyltransferase 1 [Aplysia californica]XP_005112354.1 leucine carboxyl methyltransferase 1 [Aplysia californica]XP_035829334.1 leucine carboxyl methyltransferase 1 [Aplysia californica]